MSDRDDHDDYDDGGNPDRVDRDESVEPGDWGGDAAENTMATASGDATAEPEHRRADAGIDAVVAPWETGHGKGGPVRATIEVFASILLAAIAAIVLIFAGLFGYVILTGGAEPGLVAGLLLSLVGSQAGFALVAYGFLRYRGESIRNLGIAVPDFKQSVLVVVGVVGAFVLAIAAGSAVQALGLEAAENSTAAAASEVPSSFLLLIPSPSSSSDPARNSSSVASSSVASARLRPPLSLSSSRARCSPPCTSSHSRVAWRRA